MTGKVTHRRRFLLSASVALGLVAGCLSGDEQGGRTDPTTEGMATDGEPTTGESTPGEDDGVETDGEQTGAPTDGGETTDDELDLREANVVDVAFEAQDDGEYRFDVTLHHDDDGEDGYANWWQVETLDGERLGRRELLHAHSAQPFTRLETISVPTDTHCVVVRGHDQTHEYGGQAVVVNFETGATTPVRQGPDPRGFADFDC
ncbi:MAG: hypothetical protein ACQETI_01510 [Halobacteriota archaeon]